MSVADILTAFMTEDWPAMSAPPRPVVARRQTVVKEPVLSRAKTLTDLQAAAVLQGRTFGISFVARCNRGGLSEAELHALDTVGKESFGADKWGDGLWNERGRPVSWDLLLRLHVHDTAAAHAPPAARQQPIICRWRRIGQRTCYNIHVADVTSKAGVAGEHQVATSGGACGVCNAAVA